MFASLTRAANAPQACEVLVCGEWAGDSVRGLADVYVRAGGRAGDGHVEGEERDAVGAQISHERLTFGAAGIHRHVHRVAMIEAHAIMHGRLPEGADR